MTREKRLELKQRWRSSKKSSRSCTGSKKLSRSVRIKGNEILRRRNKQESESNEASQYLPLTSWQFIFRDLEKQRQLEWESQKLQDMEQERQREQDRLLKLKGQNQTLTIELESFSSKVKELSQKICDTRVAVTNVKTVIDGMRTTRDTCMSEQAQFKGKIKEQNLKLVQLSQEKGRMDAKSKINTTADDQAMFTNKQVSQNICNRLGSGLNFLALPDHH